MMWGEVLIEPAKQLLTKIVNFLATLFWMLLILIVGWLIAKLIKNLVTKALKAIKLDKAAEEAGIDKFLAKGGIGYSLSEIVGLLCYWLAVLIVVVVAINAISLNVAADLLSRIVLYIPNVIISVLILVLGMFVTTFFATIVRTAASNLGVEQSKLLAKIVETVVVIFAVIMALEQLNIGAQIINTVVTIVLAALGLGFAIAFGLGCKDIVGRFVSDAIEKVKSKK